jgi:hypothetical protein
MKKILKLLFVVTALVCGTLALGYYSFLGIQFIEHNPQITLENEKHADSKIFSAEYKEGRDYFKVYLTDSVNIQIYIGDQKGDTVINERYRLVNDTIVVVGGIKIANKYFNSDKFIIKDKKVLYRLDNSRFFDTTYFMTVKVNRIKL